MVVSKETILIVAYKLNSGTYNPTYRRRALGGLGFRVWGLGFRVWGLGFGVWGLGFGVWGLGIWDLGFGV